MNKQKKKWEKPVEVVPEQEPKMMDDPLLPQKSLFRVEEAASYFGVAKSTIYLWIDHSILRAERYVNPETHVSGTLRISRASMLSCRFNARFDPMM